MAIIIDCPLDVQLGRHFHLWHSTQVYFFADKQSEIVNIAVPPDGVSLEVVLAMAISSQLQSPVPLPLQAILAEPTSSSDSPWHSLHPRSSAQGLFTLGRMHGHI